MRRSVDGWSMPGGEDGAQGCLPHLAAPASGVLNMAGAVVQYRLRMERARILPMSRSFRSRPTPEDLGHVFQQGNSMSLWQRGVSVVWAVLAASCGQAGDVDLQRRIDELEARVASLDGKRAGRVDAPDAATAGDAMSWFPGAFANAGERVEVEYTQHTVGDEWWEADAWYCRKSINGACVEAVPDGYAEHFVYSWNGAYRSGSGTFASGCKAGLWTDYQGIVSGFHDVAGVAKTTESLWAECQPTGWRKHFKDVFATNGEINVFNDCTCEVMPETGKTGWSTNVESECSQPCPSIQ